jgi:hypothetical protein
MEAARAEARRRSRARTRRDNARTRRNWALHPGTETPLWNELVRRVTPLLRPRGSKAQLARVLGVPRQRLQDCLRSKNAMLDAERTLLLLGWLEAAYRGRPPATPPPGVIEPELE